ncbi:hypothetical protein H5T88_05755 [bacterium]|nr:hypothetical protein [bacterium]
MPWIIYKTKSALRIEVDNERQIVFFTFAKAKEGITGLPQKGERRYEWENKIVFALSPEEAFDIALQAKDILERRKESLELYHRPTPNSSREEDKILSFRPAETGNIQAFISLSQGENKITVGLNRGDLFRLATALPILVAPLLFSGKE